MSLKNKIACATSCNYRLNRKVLCMKRSWDEVNSLLDTACKRRRGAPPPPPPKPAPKPRPCCLCPGLCCPQWEPRERKHPPCPPPERQKKAEWTPPPRCESPHPPQKNRPAPPPNRRCPNRNSPFYPFF